MEYSYPLSEYQRVIVGSNVMSSEMLAGNYSAAQALQWVNNNGDSYCLEGSFTFCKTKFSTITHQLDNLSGCSKIYIKAPRNVEIIHGVFFLAYVVMVLFLKMEYNWTNKKTLLALLASVIPFGTFWADWKLFRS